MVEQLNCLFQDTLGQQVDHGYLAEALRLVHAGAVDQKWMEKDGVTLLHLQVHPGVLRVIVTHSVVHLVHTTLRTHKQRVCVCVSYQVYFLEEFSLCVCWCVPPTQGSRAPAGCRCVFPAGRPGIRSACSPSPLPSKHRRSCLRGGTGSNADPDASGDETSSYLKQPDGRVRTPEPGVRQLKREDCPFFKQTKKKITLLLHTCIRRFVDQHCVHGHDVGSSETLHIVQNLIEKSIRFYPKWFTFASIQANFA